MKFNRKATTKTVNKAGGEAFSLDDQFSFAFATLTSFLKDKFYSSENEQADTICKGVKNLDKTFVAKTALYARNEAGMRSVSHLIAAELANQVKGKEWTRSFFDKIVHRVDDMMEIAACYFTKYGKPMPNAMKKGFAKAIGRFDEYALAKYRGEGSAVSLVDLVNLIHPKPTDKNAEAIRKLVKGELKSFDTWEKDVSATGQVAENEEQLKELKGDAWRNLIKERKIKYFALLRNLRNILEFAPDCIDDVCEMLTNEEQIKQSLVMPFRFLSAIKAVEQCSFGSERKVLQAINKAIDISLNNVPKFDGKTLVVLDSSGSMDGQPAEIGSLFSAVLYKTNDCDFMTFSDNAKYQTLNPMDSTITLARSMDFISGGTNFHSIFNTANKAYDRIIILSDMQGWVGYNAPTRTFNTYKQKYNCNPKVYSFDLQGYGTVMFPQNNIYCLAGFSDKTFDILGLLEKDRNALINTINSVEL